MARSDEMMSYLNARPRIVWRPSLLVLSAFLASAVLYQPNARVLENVAADFADLGDFMLAMAFAALAAAVALVVRSSRNPAWPGPAPRVCSAASVAYAVVQGIYLALLPAGMPAAASVALGVASGVLAVPLVLAWVRLYSMDLRNVMFYGALACFLSALLTWIVSLLPAPAVPVAFALLACIGALVPAVKGVQGNGEIQQETRKGMRQVAPGEPDTQGERDVPASGRSSADGSASEGGPGGFSTSLRSLLSIIWMPMLGFLVCLFVISSYTFPDVGGMHVTSELCGQIMASVIALAVCLGRWRTPLVILVNSIVVPVCVALCLVMKVFPAWSPGFVLGALTVLSPLLFLSIYALSSLVVVSAAGEFPMPYTLGIALCASVLASVAGAALSQLTGPDVNLGDVSWGILCAFFAVVIVGQGIESWRRQTMPDESEAVESAATSRAGLDASIEDLLVSRVDELASAHDLTRRETQILAYLARGFDSNYIGQSLVISANTVRTHVRNIYRKLGIASRSELRDLVWRGEKGADFAESPGLADAREMGAQAAGNRPRAQ